MVTTIATFRADNLQSSKQEKANMFESLSSKLFLFKMFYVSIEISKKYDNITNLDSGQLQQFFFQIIYIAERHPTWLPLRDTKGSGHIKLSQIMLSSIYVTGKHETDNNVVVISKCLSY